MEVTPSDEACRKAWRDFENGDFGEAEPGGVCPVCGRKMDADAMKGHVTDCFMSSHPVRYFRNDVLQSRLNAEEYWIVCDCNLFGGPNGDGTWTASWRYSIRRGKDPSDCETVSESELDSRFRLVMSMESLRKAVSDALAPLGMEDIEFGRFDGTVASLNFDIRQFIVRQEKKSLSADSQSGQGSGN